MAIGTTARARGRRDEAMASLHEALALAPSARQAVSPLERALPALGAASRPEAGRPRARGEPRGVEVRRGRRQRVRDGQRADGRIGGAGAARATRAGARGDAGGARDRAQVAVEDRRSRARSSICPTSSCGATLQRGARPRAAVARARASSSATRTRVATSKANMGFALFGLGRVPEGKRLTDEALAGYERTGATAEIAGTARRIRPVPREGGRLQGGARALPSRAQAERRDRAAGARARRARAAGEIRIGQAPARDRAPQSRERRSRRRSSRTSVLQQRGLVAARRRCSRCRSSSSPCSTASCARPTALLGEKNRELSFQSSRDPLTALYNRRYFQDFMRRQPARRGERRRADGTTIEALLLIDLDHFKETNDRYGHAAGDAVLVAVAQRLRDTLRETDMIVRWGGEEFLVFVAATQAGQARRDRRADHARDRRPSPSSTTARVISITASVGFVPMPLPPREDPLPWERAIGLADMALYLAKVHGRNRGYGIRELVDADNETLAAVERDLEAAWRGGSSIFTCSAATISPTTPAGSRQRESPAPSRDTDRRRAHRSLAGGCRGGRRAARDRVRSAGSREVADGPDLAAERQRRRAAEEQPLRDVAAAAPRRAACRCRTGRSSRCRRAGRTGSGSPT